MAWGGVGWWEVWLKRMTALYTIALAAPPPHYHRQTEDTVREGERDGEKQTDRQTDERGLEKRMQGE